jgi:hypothetical protein
MGRLEAGFPAATRESARGLDVIATTETWEPPCCFWVLSESHMGEYFPTITGLKENPYFRQN